MKLKQNACSRGFTLVEILIVIAIIGLLAAIAIPNLVKARGTAQRNACIKNLQEIDGGKERWAIETRKSAGAAVVDAEINAYIKGGAPTCPGGGAYTYNILGDNPSCSITGHSLTALSGSSSPTGGAGAGGGAGSGSPTP